MSPAVPPVAGRRGAGAEAAAALVLQGFGASGSRTESGRAELFPGELGLPGHREGLHLQGQHGSLGWGHCFGSLVEEGLWMQVKNWKEGREVEALRRGGKVDHIALRRNKWREQDWEEMETLKRMERRTD